MATTTSASLDETLAILHLPSLDELTEQQVRGQACVWDGVPLSGLPAVHLGSRTTKRAGGEVRWYPRGCPRCIGKQAHRALLDHASSCEQCADEASRCGIGRGLYRLMREHRR
ncbi:hypothetical protein ACFWOX_34175 [Streptomyces sp. NPDC058467]|uniref:hypothetical protein n=1 Tax=Streptomyces sp. NPDC058467 TaxID=3346513 RepID=UPI00364CF171